MSLASALGKWLVRELPEVADHVLASVAKKFEGQEATAAVKQAAAAEARRASTTSATRAAPGLAVPRAAAPPKPLAVSAAIVKKVSGANKRAVAGAGYDAAAIAERYPETAPPTLAVDPKSGKEFLQKTLSPEAEALSVARKAAQKDIEAGNYQPYFDVSQRFYADPAPYNLQGNTLTDAVPKKADTIAKYAALANEPGALARLSEAYQRGLPHPGAADWYATGQLEKAFIDQYGPDLGRQMYKQRFGDAMAATTGGADPTSNLLMANYGNVLHAAGESVPKAAYDLPFPIGGRYASGNMAMFDKLIGQGRGLTTDNPKRFNFSGNFMGDRSRATIDEQMSGLFDPALKQPPGDSYGVYEKALADLAAKHGVLPANFQDIAWAGGKLAKTPNFQPKPMIQIINEAIERTARVTGQEPDDVVAQALVSAKRPTYAKGGRVEAPDYDYAAAAKAGLRRGANGHLPDTYKLPNHMTFSDESVYSQPGQQGGHWSQGADGKWVFWASPFNVKQHPVREMQDYFGRVEPDSLAVYPSNYRLP